MPRKPAPPAPPVDMIRDARIRALGPAVVADKARVALIVYETHDGRIVVESHDGSKSTAKGLLIHACEASGLFS